MHDTSTDWRAHLVEDDAGIRRVLERTHRIAVLGIKIDSGQPAHYVPEYAQRAGYEIVPVPVYYPEVTEILGEPVYRRLADVPAHLDDILAARPDAVWLQSGIYDDQFAERLAREGIAVVQDRCLMVELRGMGR